MENITYEELKEKVIQIARESVTSIIDEIESGIDEGLYEEEDNVTTLASLNNSLQLIDEFEKRKS